MPFFCKGIVAIIIASIAFDTIERMWKAWLERPRQKGARRDSANTDEQR